MAGQSYSPGTPVSSTNKTDLHDIAKILLKVALNTIDLSLNQGFYYSIMVLFIAGYISYTFVFICIMLYFFF